MSKTQLNRIQELEERVEIMDKIFEENQEKMRMMSDMMSLMRQHMELMNTHIVKIAQQESKSIPPVAPVPVAVTEQVSTAEIEQKVQEKVQEKEQHEEKTNSNATPSSKHTAQMRRIM